MEFESHGRTFLRRDFDHLEGDVLDWAVKLIQNNMEFRHSRSKHLPWCKKLKLEELQDSVTRAIVIYDETDTPVGLSTYQITSEPDLQDKLIPCLYWYELQVLKGYQGYGIGSRMVLFIEEIARLNSQHCQKIMLTAFKALPRNRAYRSPIEFYGRWGFKPDQISPSRCLSPRAAALYDYEIMSKDV